MRGRLVIVTVLALSALRLQAPQSEASFWCERPYGSAWPQCETGYLARSDCTKTGVIGVTVAPWASIAEVVAAHGGGDFRPSIPGPYSETQLRVGVHRVFRISVPIGEEWTRSRDYGFDPRVEFAGPAGGCIAALNA